MTGTLIPPASVSPLTLLFDIAASAYSSAPVSGMARIRTGKHAPAGRPGASSASRIYRSRQGGTNRRSEFAALVSSDSKRGLIANEVGPFT
ncbi:hypothetical protein [Streptomyces sp. NPDC058542]|uniref:hypothetical protein n=1 Tax=Streptomyces sp. NPDC058542 TaxID=3346543 RepID=UPI00365DDAD3